MKRRQCTAEFKRVAAYQIIIEGVAVWELSDVSTFFDIVILVELWSPCVVFSVVSSSAI